MNLDEIREQIDEIDAQILDLFCRRMDLVKNVAEYKIENSIPVFHPGREQSILDRARMRAGEAYGDYAAALFQRMMEVSRRMQEKMVEEQQEKSSGPFLRERTSGKQKKRKSRCVRWKRSFALRI